MRIKYIPLVFLIVFLTASTSAADTQTLTILGANGVQGDIDPYTEASLDGGQTWQPAYLTGWHPWGFAPGTNSWVNFDPSPFVGLNSTTDYRIRFHVPSDYTDPQMTFVIKADNRARLSINGVFIAEFDGSSSGSAGDQVIAQALNAGLNEITIRLTDWGGWVGLNYRIDLTMESDEEPVILPPSIFADADDDGVLDEEDFCPDTPEGAVIDETGCSGPQLIDQECPLDGAYRNHGEYVSCVAHAAEDVLELGLITEEEKDAIVSDAGHSDIGKKEKGKGKK